MASLFSCKGIVVGSLRRGGAILTERHSPQQTQVQGFLKNKFPRIKLLLSSFSIPIPIAIPIYCSIGVGVGIGIDFLFLNTVQIESL
jgi:hypothetical protein